MPVFLEVRSGAQKGVRIRLQSGGVLRVGRTGRADLSFADDSHMSGIHFSLSCDGDRSRLTDLNSSNGTLVNGRLVKAIDLAMGDSIIAGNTIFAVLVEPEETRGTTLPFPVESPLHRLLTILRLDFQPLYAVLDAARDIRILALLLHHKEECQSLYEGPEDAKLAQVAPYLVRLQPESKLLEALVEEGWGKSWGVYLTSVSDLGEVRRHLRHFLQARMPDGEQVYFRFYDPRVLRVFLPTCTADETTQFFGPIKRYLMEGEEASEVWEFTTIERGAEKKVIPLARPVTQETKVAS
jgi:pSer/pThr/pTyr-binding forkhead associated (FHA) protein